MRLWQPVDWLASRPALSCIACALLALLLVLTRVALTGIPAPFVHDEFSYLLAADTFAQGRLTNPAHPMALHFETMHTLFHPTYQSKYPPAQGAMLAVGQLLGHPILGVWISIALLGALLCWMLQGWLPARWALAGTILGIVQMGLSYWGHSYWGGAVAACGGALLFGALPRLMDRPNLRDSLLMGLGITLLAHSRPYEGALAALPSAIVLLRWVTKQRGAELRATLRRFVLPVSLVLVLMLAMVGYYNQRVTGNAALTPWVLHHRQYSVVPFFIWQKPKPENEWPAYRHEILRQFHTGWERNLSQGYDGIEQVRKSSNRKFREIRRFFLGPLLTLPLFLLPIVLARDKRMWLPLAICATGLIGSLLTVYMFAHYLAPVMGLIYLLVARALQYLAQIRPGGKPVGPMLVALIIVSSVTSTLYYRTYLFYPVPAVGLNHRPQIIKQLQQTDGRHLIFVSYGDRHTVHQEWVFNGADLDNAKILWARDMKEEKNQELVRYYPTRRFWRLHVEDDQGKPALEKYFIARAAE